MIILAQMPQGWFVQYSVAPSMFVPCLAAWMMAFCSACRPRQISCRSPEGMPICSLRHPRSRQCSMPDGVPLWPVARMFLSLTRTAPTWRRRHVARLFTRCAISMKYSSQLGLVIVLSTRRNHGSFAHTGLRRTDENQDLASKASGSLPCVRLSRTRVHPWLSLHFRLFHREHRVLGAEGLRPPLDGGELFRRASVRERLADQIADHLHLRFAHA